MIPGTKMPLPLNLLVTHYAKTGEEGKSEKKLIFYHFVMVLLFETP